MYGASQAQKEFFKGIMPGGTIYYPGENLEGTITLTQVGVAFIDLPDKSSISPENRVIINPFDSNKSIFFYHSDEQIDQMMEEKRAFLNPFSYADFGEQWYSADEGIKKRFMKLDVLGFLKSDCDLGSFIKTLADAHGPIVSEPIYELRGRRHHLWTPELYYATNHMMEDTKPFDGLTLNFYSVGGLPKEVESEILKCWQFK